MSNHISLVCAWINFMPSLSSVLSNSFYSLFELTGLWGRGKCEECQYFVSFKL